MSAQTTLRRALLAVGIGVLAGAGVANAQVITRPMPPASTPSVQPSGGEHNLTAGWVPNDLDGRELERPAHPPLDQIPPMPMPDPADDFPNPNPTWGVLAHDATTGQTWEVPTGPHTDVSGLVLSPEGDYPGADNLLEWEPNLRGFGSMTPAGSLNTWPRSGNVKLVMEFIDQNGIARWFTASGSMQDAGVVLTAAHVVYARNPNGINIFDWASRIYIYPAWDGVSNNGQFAAPDSDEVIQNFGWCRGDFFLAGTDYVNNGDFDADIGCIRINRGSSRNVGMLTGWFGWAYGFSCSEIQSRTYHNFSYPAENCGGGLHTGTTMYYWFGTWDSCPGNQLHLDTTPGCLTAVWGGMSGSGAYYIDGTTRYVHAVASNSNRTTSGNYARLWDTFVTAMNTFINDTRGNTFDLELLRCRSQGSTTIQAGTASDNMFEVYVANATNVDPAVNTYTIRVYLSTNNNISEADTLLATWNYSWDFAGMSGVNFLIPNIFIPADVAPGTYWIGVILDSGTDAFVDNNDTDTWDAQQVTITLAAPDAPTYVSPANGSTNNDINVDLDWNAAARATSYDVYFGTDPTPDAGEYVGNTSSTFWSLGTLAFDTTYYWQIVARNSAGTTAGPVWSFRTEPAEVDLQAVSCNADAGTYFRGVTIPVDFVVTNIGNIASGSYDVEIRASTNNFISTADPLMTTLTYGSLNPGATRTVTNQGVQIPLTLPAGTYYIGTRIVSGSDVSTSNNIVADTDTIQVQICPADLASPWGVLDFFDVQTFLNLYSAHDPLADLNNDGQWDFFDVQEYLAAFSRGC